MFEGILADGGPARAAGTAAGASISSTASATYNDPNDAGQTLDATSDTVSVTVAEVAGVSGGGAAVTDTTPGHANNLLPGDLVNYGFTVTNIGNGANAITAQNRLCEASAFQNGTVGTQPRARAVLLLTRTGFTQGVIPAADTLAYGLGLNVNNSAPTGAGASHALAAADLAAAP